MIYQISASGEGSFFLPKELPKGMVIQNPRIISRRSAGGGFDAPSTVVGDLALGVTANVIYGFLKSCCTGRFKSVKVNDKPIEIDMDEVVRTIRRNNVR